MSNSTTLIVSAAGVITGTSGDASLLGSRVRLLHGGVDRIQGHTHGRLLIATGPQGPAATELVIQQLCHHAKELGYVADHV